MPSYKEEKYYYIYTKDKQLEYVASSLLSAEKYVNGKTGETIRNSKSYVYIGLLFMNAYYICDHLKYKSRQLKLVGSNDGLAEVLSKSGSNQDMKVVLVDKKQIRYELVKDLVSKGSTIQDAMAVVGTSNRRFYESMTKEQKIELKQIKKSTFSKRMRQKIDLTKINRK